MKKDKDAFIKILIVLVIASLSLLAIVYVMQSNRGDGGNFTNPFRKAEIEKYTDGEKVFVSEADQDYLLEKCVLSPWGQGEEKAFDFINEDYGIKFKYLNRSFSNEHLIADPYFIKHNEDNNFEILVPYWPEAANTYPCDGGIGIFPRLSLAITDASIGFEEFDSKGNINGIDYIEYMAEGLGENDQRIVRVVIEDGVAYKFSAAILDGFDGEAQLDYVFESLEFLK